MQRMRRTESPPFQRESVVPAAHQSAVADLDVLMRAKNENPVNPPPGGSFGIPTVGDGKPSHLMGSRTTLSRKSLQPSKWRRTTSNVLGLHGDSAKEDSGEDEDDEDGDEDDAGKDPGKDSGKDEGKDAAEDEADKMMED